MDCLLYGIGSPYVHEVDEILFRLAWPVRAYVVNMRTDYRPLGLSPVVDLADLDPSAVELPAVFVLTTPGHRQSLEWEARSKGFRTFPAVVDPTTVVARSVRIGEGVVVNSNGSVGANVTLGRFASLNRSVSVGHDAVVEDFASLGPGCILCGDCRVGPGAFIGAGAVLAPGVSVGANAIVGAGAVVVSDVPPHTVAFGNPARVVTENIVGHNGVAVVTAGVT